MTGEPLSSFDDQEVPGAQALVRGLDVLLAIGMASEPMRFAELQRAVDIPKGSLHRLLAALQSRRLIRIDPHTKRYTSGGRVFDLARRTLDQSSIIRAAKPELSRLARNLRRACCLYINDGEEVFVLDFEDPDASEARVIRVWPRLPTASCAAGIAIMAWLEKDARKGALETGIGQARALGYAITGPAFPGVAAPILDGGGYPVAAICCAFDPETETAETLHEFGRILREAAQRASGNVGCAAQTQIAERPKKVTRAVRTLDTGRDFMGENPVWCAQTGRLWWLDILAPALRCRDVATGETQRFLLNELTGGLALTTSGRLLLAGRKGLNLFDPQSGSETLLFDPEDNRPDHRFNSASMDQAGNLWSGTMPLDSASSKGSLYRIKPDLSVEVMLPEIMLPKNPAFSRDGTRLYLSDGELGQLCVYDISPEGSLSNKRVLVQGTPETGTPNGIAVDVEGCIWVAMMGGWSVNRYDRTGKLLQQVALPVPMPTALCFGGANLDRLFVTSTYLRVPVGYSSVAPQSGNLLEIDAGVTGPQTPKFSI